MLRDHNTVIPVKIIIIDELDEWFYESLIKYDVEVIQKPFFISPGEEDYFPINRIYLKELSEPSILHIDADTFIFGDVDILFETYKHVDFAAERAKWAARRPDWNDEFTYGISPVVSGVHIWNHGAIQKWDLLENCKLLREGKLPASNFLYRISDTYYNREEFSIPYSLKEHGLKYEYFRPQHCKVPVVPGDLDNASQSIIFHSYASNWKRIYTQLFGNKMSPKYVKSRQ